MPFSIKNNMVIIHINWKYRVIDYARFIETRKLNVSTISKKSVFVSFINLLILILDVLISWKIIRNISINNVEFKVEEIVILYY